VKLTDLFGVLLANAFNFLVAILLLLALRL